MPLLSWLQRLADAAAGGRPGGGGRTTGRPTSSNGASSLHLAWDGPVRLREAWATLEVLEPPTVPELYFWALQVSVTSGGRRVGGAHLGLQHHPRHPGGGAVNWGGYRARGGELDGTTSALPSATGNPNTRDLAWEPGVAYRLRVHPSPDQGWRGTVTDTRDGHEVVVRDLLLEGDGLEAPMVWSEVFAACDQPSVAVRWSGLGGVDLEGREVAPSGLRVNYQSHDAGGCANTTCEPDGEGVVQRTATARTTPQGAVLSPGAR